MTLSTEDRAGASDPLLASYEQVPYHGGPIRSSHPDSLATVATLYGMSPAPVGACRVLELGCATGANVLGMALSLPGSAFVGIDLAPGQIARARERADAVGLRNVDLRAMSIDDIGDDFGTFDYIICHGVYSWVPPAIRDAILRVCARNLAPNGVAYVSYNTFPGWHARSMVRDMILFHDDPSLPPLERVARGRAMVEFLATAATPNSVHRAALEQELVMLRGMTDSHFLHEELETVNQPVYVAEFANRAAAKGLQYLGEAGLPNTEGALSPEAKQTLRRWSSDRVRFEQYVDFARNRTFRRTLLCHAGATRALEPSAAAIPHMFLASRAAPTAEPANPASVIAEKFQAPDGTTVETNHPLVRATLHLLFDALPRAVAFGDVWREVSDRTAGASTDDAAWLAESLLQCATFNLVELHVSTARCVAHAGPRPTASALARVEAAGGGRVTNLRHYAVELLEFDRALLPHLDGQRDRSALLQLVRDTLALGQRPPGEDTFSADDDAIARVLDDSLRRLARAALLVA